jgi:Uma2 family endonuclease
MSAAEPSLSRVDLRMPAGVRLDDDLFFALCEANRDYRIERNARGDIQIMPPTGALTGHRNADLLIDFGQWARADGRGLVFGSSTGFDLPNGATRSPDLAWVLRERLARVPPARHGRFLPLAPDLVIELASPSDRRPVLREALREKLREFQDNGVQLGWLILPAERAVEVYRPGTVPTRLDHPKALTDPDLLPGLVLDLTRIWAPTLV